MSVIKSFKTVVETSVSLSCKSWKEVSLGLRCVSVVSDRSMSEDTLERPASFHLETRLKRKKSDIFSL